jgi:hypothetical protein
MDGRAITYRGLVARAGAEGERNLRLIVQKVEQTVDGDVVTNQLVGTELEARPVDKDTSLDDVSLVSTRENESFVFTLRDKNNRVSKCTFSYDPTGPGTETTASNFHCDAPAAAAAVTAEQPGLVDGVPFASGQVIRMRSAFQNGRATTYRAMVVRAGGEPENNVELVIQKVIQEVLTDGSISSKLFDHLEIPPAKLPGGTEARVTDITMNPPSSDTDGFVFAIDTGSGASKCTFDFDGSSAGTPTTMEFFHCDGAAAAE